MDDALFRSEVLARTDSHVGSINVTTTLSQKFVAVLVFMLLVGCVSVLVVGRYSRSINVGGELIRLPASVGADEDSASLESNRAIPSPLLIDGAINEAMLHASLMVPASAVPYVDLGGAVALQVDAFPSRKFGLLRGHVARIGDEPHRLRNDLSSQVFYEVHISLGHPGLFAYGREIALRPGMTVRLNLQLETRRLIEWVFEPLYAGEVAVQDGKS